MNQTTPTKRPAIQALLLAAAIAAVPATVAAQAGGAAHDSHHAAPTAAAAQTGEWVDAEVRRIDLAGKKLTLKHGEIKHLDMPPMTMVFGLADGAAPAEQLAALKVGDKVKIQVAGKDGRTIVTALKR
jgi:Cu/Ag efflux protein CusF